MANELSEGGCFCGSIRYEFPEGEHTIVNCHCGMCRKTSGAPYVSWIVVPESEFRYTQGAPARLESSKAGSRFFCSKCGTPVACMSTDHTGIVDVTVGSLDQPADYVPTVNIFEDSKLPWT